MIRFSAALVSAALLVLMVGCASSAPDSESPKPAVSANATPPPPASEPAAVIVATDGIQVVTAGGTVLERFGWQDPASTTIPILTSAFGAAPTTTDFSASDPLPRTEYVWGGFVLQVNASTAQSDLNAATLVHVHTARVGTIDVRMVNGLSVGSTRSDALAEDPDPSSSSTALNFEPIDLGGGALNFVGVTLTNDSISSIDAPIHNYGY